MPTPRLSPQDQERVAALYDETAVPLRRFVCGLPTWPGGSSDRDTVLSAFKEAIENWEKIGAWSRPRQMGWLRQVCRNQRVDELRRWILFDKLSPQLHELYALPVDDPEEVTLGRIALDACAAAIRRMPPQQRMVAEMAWLLLISRDQIAAALEISPGAVRVHLSHARKALAKQVGPHLPFPLEGEAPGQDGGDIAEEKRRGGHHE